MLEIVANVKNDFDKALAAVKTQDGLEALRVQFLGKKGAVTEVLKGLKDMDVETKKQVGQEMNILKNEIDTAIREYGAKLEEGLKNGVFSDEIKKGFIQILDYFGQNPIIVRSSSFLEDGYGNAFAGKYESVFCVNRGSLEERLELRL